VLYNLDEFHNKSVYGRSVMSLIL